MEVEMVKIDEEQALAERNTLMWRISKLVADAHMQNITIDEAEEAVTEIDDFLSRTLGLDPEKIEHWLDA
jgi:chorismate mutase